MLRSYQHRTKPMRTIIIAFLMTFATQAAAELQISFSSIISDAQVATGNNKFTGKLKGYGVQVETQLFENYSLGVEYNDGIGELNPAASKFTFYEAIVYGIHKKAYYNLSFNKWILGSQIGLGFSDKASNFKNINYRQTQFPILLGLNVTSRSGVSVGISGYGQLDNLKNNRVGTLYFSYPLSGRLNLVGRYTSHKSKLRSFQHCGSDYSFRLSYDF